MAYNILSTYVNVNEISLEIIRIEKVNSNCYLITTSSLKQFFIDRTELETIRTSLSTALDKFKKL